MIFSVPEDVKKSCAAGLSAYETQGYSFLSFPEIDFARRVARGEKINRDSVRDIAQWWAHNSRYLSEEENSPLGIHAQIKGGRVGREWFAREHRGAIEKELQRAWTKAQTNDARDWVSLRYMPYFGIDADGNWYTNETRVHKLGEIIPGVLDTHGLWLGGDVKNVGEIVKFWDNDLGRNVDIALDPTHPQFEEYKKAAQEGRLMVSPGFIPGYFDFDSKTGFVTDVGIGEMSLIIVDETQRAKHPGAVGVSYSERETLNALQTRDNFTKADRSCPTCRRPSMMSDDKALALFKCCGVDYAPLFSPPNTSAVSDQKTRRKGVTMAAKATLKGVVKGMVGEGKAADLLYRVIDVLFNDELQEMDDENMDGLIKAIADKKDEDVAETIKACGMDDMSEDDKKLVKAFFLKAMKGTGVTMPDEKELVDARAKIQAQNAEIVTLKTQAQELAQATIAKDDEAWFTNLVKANKANPSEKVSMFESLANARKADALVKGGEGQSLKLVKAAYDGRIPTSDAMPLTPEMKADLLAKGFKITAHETDEGKEGAKVKAKISEQVNAMLNATPEGRQALSKNKKAA